ncbi:MAG: asparagine synthase (glutamine-hydrolyzing) [Deltaproteobacteria bacterium]|nr:asparagine synthase (glutamine-hydrolyzing) [Deltaproteobacteria bacterium]
MCGICGFLSFDSQADLSPRIPDLTTMPKALTHRGPENLGYWQHQNIFLAQTRLKILDLSSEANQPIFNEDKSIVLVFNGEIYNFKKLRHTLVQKGHTFISQGDSETIVHLYEEEGDRFISHLEGMFAFALWDNRQKKLILARDRTGKKPLFYYQSQHLFAFASEIKAFFALSDIDIHKNEDLFAYYFLYGNIPTPYTFYKNIHSLEPAHYLVLENSKPIQKINYWNIAPYYLNKKNTLTEKDAKIHIRHLVKEAISKRLISDVPLGAFLSGGIDSSIISAVVTQELHQPLQTFSIGFEGDPLYDETPYAKLVATHFKTNHREFHVGSQALLELIDPLLYHYDGPFGDSSCIPTAIVSKMAKQYVTVVLTGDGGDEIFGGYNRFLAIQLMTKMPKFLKYFKDLPFPKWQRWIATADLNHIDQLTQLTSYFYTDLFELLNKDYASQRTIVKNFHNHPFLQDVQQMTLLSKLLYLNLKTYLVDDLNIKMDRASMMASLETRAPFLDHTLIEYCASLPDHFLIRNFNKKYILKEAYKEVLPPQIIHRKKAGFAVPLGKWFRGPLKSYIQDEFQNPNSISPYLNPHRIRTLLKSHFDEKKDESLRIWNLLMFKKWIEQLPSWKH